LKKSAMLDEHAEAPPFLTGGGEMGALIRAYHWADSPLGNPAEWPIELKTPVSLLLTSPQQMFIAWGEYRTWLHNDSFTPILGDKHPTALGRPAMEVWAEAKDTLEPMFDRVFAGEPFYMDDFSLDLERNRRLAEAHFSFSYMPVRDQQGAVAGLFGTCIETTIAVVNRYDGRRHRKDLRSVFHDKTLGQVTGLGLSMLYGFVRQSGGQVHLLDHPGPLQPAPLDHVSSSAKRSLHLPALSGPSRLRRRLKGGDHGHYESTLLHNR
jgi:hypothetical protein